MKAKWAVGREVWYTKNFNISLYSSKYKKENSLHINSKMWESQIDRKF